VEAAGLRDLADRVQRVPEEAQAPRREHGERLVLLAGRASGVQPDGQQRGPQRARAARGERGRARDAGHERAEAEHEDRRQVHQPPRAHRIAAPPVEDRGEPDLRRGERGEPDREAPVAERREAEERDRRERRPRDETVERGEQQAVHGGRSPLHPLARLRERERRSVEPPPREHLRREREREASRGGGQRAGRAQEDGGGDEREQRVLPADERGQAGGEPEEQRVARFAAFAEAVGREQHERDRERGGDVGVAGRAERVPGERRPERHERGGEPGGLAPDAGRGPARGRRQREAGVEEHAEVQAEERERPVALLHERVGPEVAEQPEGRPEERAPDGVFVPDEPRVGRIEPAPGHAPLEELVLEVEVAVVGGRAEPGEVARAVRHEEPVAGEHPGQRQQEQERREALHEEWY
jgi:hypothetical protein